MKTIIYNFSYQDKIYSIPVTYKSQRGLYLRMNKDGFSCTAPRFVSEIRVKKFISDSLPKLIARRAKKDALKIAPRETNYTYLFGNKIDRYISDDELKTLLNEKLIYLVRYNEKIMGIKKPYNIKIKKMSSRYGSNSSQTYTLNFQLALVHFSLEIINSVVVHELEHFYVHNHQVKFYQVVYKYCPNYDELKRKLRKGIYA